MKSTVNGGEQALHGLAPKLNGLAPKRANSASVRRRKTNDPSLESLSSCRHEELAIDGVRAPRATQAVLEPGAIIYTLKVPTAAPYSSMQAWIGVSLARCNSGQGRVRMWPYAWRSSGSSQRHQPAREHLFGDIYRGNCNSHPLPIHQTRSHSDEMNK